MPSLWGHSQAPWGWQGCDCAIWGLGVPKSGGWQAWGGQLPIWCLPVACIKLHSVVPVAKWPQSAPPMTPQAQPRPWGVVGLPTHASHKLHCTCLGACCPHMQSAGLVWACNRRHKIGNWPNWGKLGAPPLRWGTMGVVVGAHTMTWPTVGPRMLGEALGPLGWLLQACCKLACARAKLQPWCLGALGPPLVGATSPLVEPQPFGALGQPQTSASTATTAPHRCKAPPSSPQGCCQIQ